MSLVMVAHGSVFREPCRFLVTLFSVLISGWSQLLSSVAPCEPGIGVGLTFLKEGMAVHGVCDRICSQIGVYV